METKYLHNIHFTTDFSESKATASEIAHFLEKLDDLVKEDARLKTVDGCFGFYYLYDIESGIEDNRAELVSIINLSSSISFKTLTDDWFNDKSSKYYQLISQFNGLKIELYCSEFIRPEKEFVRHKYDILVTSTGATVLQSSETPLGKRGNKDYVAIDIGHFTTSVIDKDGKYHDFSEPPPDKYQLLKNTTDWIENSSSEEFLGTQPK